MHIQQKTRVEEKEKEAEYIGGLIYRFFKSLVKEKEEVEKVKKIDEENEYLNANYGWNAS